MLLYEVNLSVDNTVAEAFATWLRGHILEMLASDGFTEARWYQRDPEDGRQLWTVQYQVKTHQHLQNYFDQHAEQMRQDGLTRFGGHFSANRRILYLRETVTL